MESISVEFPIFVPFRWPIKSCGAFDIDSIPPAIIALYSPALILVAANIAALSDEPHTLLMVVHGVLTGKPAPKATCLAGF